MTMGDKDSLSRRIGLGVVSVCRCICFQVDILASLTHEYIFWYGCFDMFVDVILLFLVLHVFVYFFVSLLMSYH